MPVIVKIVGISYISEFASDICRDSGYAAIGNQIQIFGKLSIEKQVETLLGILRIFGLENQGADLSNIGGQAKNGTMKPHKRISDKEEVLLINQSPTGIYENVVDLLTV